MYGELPLLTIPYVHHIYVCMYGFSPPHLHVVGRANESGRQVKGSLQGPRNAKVSQTYAAIVGQEDVLGLQVAVQDVVGVHVLHRKGDLAKGQRMRVDMM